MEGRIPDQDRVAVSPCPMITSARFSIGIDLGTTNCALAFVPLDSEARSEIFGIQQWETPSTVMEAAELPSFLYLPDQATAAQIQPGMADCEEWVVGRLARKRAAESPGRVVHSAKSWLCHHTSDRSARFLPWGSEDIARDKKISPVRASALILDHLRRAWNSRFAATGVGSEFDSQEITLTVPASFDAAAQRLTLTAALEAGFPETIRLLEEPQAAFYCWLERHDIAADLESKLPNRTDGIYHVLVVDIGGGTSDFSLFEFRSAPSGRAPIINRLAVGDHILLGGDNVDLAIAHLLEPRLIGERGKLSGTQWDDLVARCRDLKENILSRDGDPDERFAVSLPGRGAGLVAGTHTAQLTRAELRALLLDGFFPECDSLARPYRTQAALKEWGLPYASDGAVTRHLADFLRGRPRIDAVLFNGGSLHPEPVRQRICLLVGKWQGGRIPLGLENVDPDLAVARGAALFGRSLHRSAKHIEAGSARSVFLEVLSEQSHENAGQARRSLVCVLPRGASSQQRFDITGLPLEVRTNHPARFQAYSSTRDDSSKAGDIVDWNERAFNALPPLATIIKIADPALGEAANTLPVTLTANVNELGLLQVACVSADNRIRQSWPLEFDLRQHEQESQSALQLGPASSALAQIKPNASAEALEAAQIRIRSWFTRSPRQREALTAARLLRNLEQILGTPKSEWNAALVRALWPALECCMDLRKQSVDHEETWLILAGFLLRPGFGVAADKFRIDSLWSLREQGLNFPGKRIKAQGYILWRRVAGGLTERHQQQILAPEFDRIRTGENLPPELIQLAGSLERLPNETKTELSNLFIDAADQLAREKKHCAPFLTALGSLLSRAPFYAGPESVVSPDLVGRAYEIFRAYDWASPELREMQSLFLRAARVIGNRNFDLPKALRYRIATKLEKSGIAPQKTGKLKELVPIGGSERLSLYDEGLPPGLILGNR
jgi:molecular chaperone DnaK (HSP70)